MENEILLNQKIIFSQTIELINFFEKDIEEIYDIVQKEIYENPFLEIYNYSMNSSEPDMLNNIQGEKNIWDNLFIQVEMLKLDSQEKKKVKDILSYMDNKGFLKDRNFFLKIIKKYKKIVKELNGKKIEELIEKIKNEIEPQGLCSNNSVDYIKFQILQEGSINKKEKELLKKK